ncbi:MAG TPA: hypothetical protein PLS29_10670 [Acidimicrobiales bacterium]|nr:hypothetical protein [Acidimicrobiales bacterium]
MFVAVFGFFVLALAVLSGLIVRWAIRRDRERRRPRPPEPGAR